jgi:hypothetical protein
MMCFDGTIVVQFGQNYLPDFICPWNRGRGTCLKDSTHVNVKIESGDLDTSGEAKS